MFSVFSTCVLRVGCRNPVNPGVKVGISACEFKFEYISAAYTFPKYSTVFMYEILSSLLFSSLYVKVIRYDTEIALRYPTLHLPGFQPRLLSLLSLLIAKK